ncbi:MAG: hypothetical protein Q8N66_08535 [Bacteroidota bacterium]|nr:hypothetical protein [Bacteroidota bacterium]
MDYVFYKEYDGYSLKLRRDGIMHLHFILAGKIDIEKYKEIINNVGEILEYKKAPFLISTEPFEIINDEIRDFVATEEGAPYSVADAILSDGIGFTLLANFYIRMKKPLRPTKLFTNEAEALKWLNKFI